MIKRILLFLTIFLFGCSICVAGDSDSGYGTHIAVEFKKDNKSYNPPIIGHLEYTGSSLDIVSFFEGIGGVGILAQPQVFIIMEKKIVSRGVHHLKGKNQYGTIASGTIDFRDQITPKITFITEGGVVITNISNEGKNWAMKQIPNIKLGQ